MINLFRKGNGTFILSSFLNRSIPHKIYSCKAISTSLLNLYFILSRFRGGALQKAPISIKKHALECTVSLQLVRRSADFTDLRRLKKGAEGLNRYFCKAASNSVWHWTWKLPVYAGVLSSSAPCPSPTVFVIRIELPPSRPMPGSALLPSGLVGDGEVGVGSDGSEMPSTWEKFKTPLMVVA